MYKARILLFSLITFLLSASISNADVPAPTPTHAPAAPLILAYFTGNEESYNSLQAYSAYLDILSVDVFNVQDDGSIVQYDDLGTPQFAREHGLQVYACVSNYRGDPLYDFDPALARVAILTYKDKVIDQLVKIAREDGYTGINIDLEDIALSADIEADRAAFTVFIEDLAARLHVVGKKLIVSVPAKSMDNPDDDWAYPYDLAALGQVADYLQLMTYDQHGPWSEPGPVAGLDWVDACVDFETSLVDPAKLLMGLPAYAYDWDLTASNADSGTYSVQDLYWTDIPALLKKTGVVIQYDEDVQSPFLTYQENSHEHIAWYEDAASIRVKSQLVSQYELGGLSVWALGQEDETFWQTVLAGLSKDNH